MPSPTGAIPRTAGWIHCPGENKAREIGVGKIAAGTLAMDRDGAGIASRI
jgi:hypothetical protein